MTLVNRTGRSLDIYSDADTLLRTVPADGPRIHIPVVSHHHYVLDGVDIYTETWSTDASDVPDTQDGVYLIVTQPVAVALWAQGRTDVLRPGAPVFRSADGRRDVVGCIGLVSHQGA